MSRLLKQRYLIIDELGRGGMGVVYKARDIQLGNRLVAIKEMGQDKLKPDRILAASKAFEQEALMLAHLMHPNLPSIHEHFAEAGCWYLVMEFIDGETLEDYRKARGGKLPVEEVLDIGIQLCTVLDYLHTRQPSIIFRDLKPLNIMRAIDGHFYLIDFGIARHFKVGQAGDTAIAYSKGYAAPEQYGEAQTTARSDIYSLGATLHHLLSGNHPALTPFRFAPLPSQRGTKLAQLNTLIMQMVEMDESKRPANMAPVKQELQRIVAQPAGKTSLPPTQPVQFSSFPPTQPAHPRPQKPVNSPQPAALKRGQPPQPKPTGGAKQVILSPSSAPAKRGISRRAVVIGLASAGIAAVVAGGGITWWALTPHPFQGLSGPVNSVSWSPDGTKIASGSDDHTVQVWDAVKGTKLLTYQGHSNAVNSVAWSPDRKNIASGSDDYTIQVWDAMSGSKLFSQSYSDAVFSVAWSPDGTQVALGDHNSDVQVWNPATSAKLLAYQGNDSVWSVAWSPDGKKLASADHMVQVWDAVSGKQLITYQSYTNSVLSVAWSPDGTKIVLGAYDDIIQVMNAPGQ